MDHLGIEKFLVLGFCIGGPFIWNLLERAPERVVAAVPASLLAPSLSWILGVMHTPGVVVETRDEFFANVIQRLLFILIRNQPLSLANEIGGYRPRHVIKWI